MLLADAGVFEEMDAAMMFHPSDSNLPGKNNLGRIKFTMEFFGKKTVTSTYAADAGTVPSQIHGRLLSGKI